MSLVEFCKKGDFEGVKDALEAGADVNTKGEYGWTGLMWAVMNNHNSVVDLLVKTPNIDVNLKGDSGLSFALTLAVAHIIENNIEPGIEVLKLLLNVPNINVNSVTDDGQTALHLAVRKSNIEALKLVLSHPSLTALTLNQKDKKKGATPVMWAVKWDRLEHLALLADDPRVDLDTIDKEGRGLKQNSRWVFLLEF